MAVSRIYLDHNATTPPLPEVLEAMQAAARDAWANPGSRHAEGRAARRALESARECIAAILDADPKEVIFTSGGTESINMAVAGLAGRSAAGRPGPHHVAFMAGEHPATREAMRRLEASGYSARTLPIDEHGLLVAGEIERLPWDSLRLVTVILAHNETGIVLPIEPLAVACRARHVPLHVDAVQAVGKIPVRFHELNVAALSLAAHKFHGPRGIGALLLRREWTIPPLLVGGGQEAERRAGTEPVWLAVGMAKALENWNRERETRASRVAALRDRLQQSLQQRCPPTVVHGASSQRLPNTLNIAFPGIDGEAFLVALDLEGVACSLGSACSSGSTEPAPVLIAMGCPRNVALASVRFSLGFQTTEAEIDDAVERIARVVHRLRQFASSAGSTGFRDGAASLRSGQVS